MLKGHNSPFTNLHKKKLSSAQLQMLHNIPIKFRDFSFNTYSFGDTRDTRYPDARTDRGKYIYPRSITSHAFWPLVYDTSKDS